MTEFDSNNAKLPRLLIIEDNADMADILAELGTEVGYLVEIADSVASAQEKYRTVKPSLIILDLSLVSEAEESGSDGDESLELLEFFSSAECKAKILIISGMSRRKRELIQMRGQRMRLRIIGHIPKPFDVDKVQALLSDLYQGGN